MDTKITFGDLDMLTKHWVSDLKSFEALFHNQLEEMKSVFLKNEKSKEKINLLEFRTAVLKYQEQELQHDLAKASSMQNQLEKILEELEKLPTVSDENISVDNRRKQIYVLAEGLLCSITNRKDELELLSKESKNIMAEKKKNPVEQLAQVMVHLLEALGNIEMQIEKMKYAMLWIENEKQKYTRRS